MRHSYFIIATILCLFSQNAHAQLVNGSKSLGGFANGNVSFSHFKQPTPQQLQLSRSISFNFSPSFAVFKNNFLLGATVGNGLRGFRAINATTVDTKYVDYSFNLNPFIRYYVKNNARKALFAFADIAYFGILSNRKLQIGNQSIYAFNKDDFNWKLGFGGHQVLTNNMVVEASVFYENNENIAFFANLRHFYMQFDKRNQNATPLSKESLGQYISKNRWQIAGSISANNNYKTKDENLLLSFSGGKMVSNHLMIGTTIGLQMSDFSHTLDTYFNLSPFARYYIGLTSRLYVYPQIGCYISISNQNYSSINFERNIGFQYFMTRNLALTCITNGYFSYFKNNERSIRANANLSFGFNYFIN